MVKVIAKNFAKEENLDEFITLCRELVEATRKEEGCISYEVYQDGKDKTILTMIEEWKNSDVLDKHMKSEHFTRIVPMMGELASKEGEINVYAKLI